MIITDGEINDVSDTINEIVEASDNPLSIIVIGVGDATFGTMQQLDADVNPLKSSKTNEYQHRDIVQFIKFEDFDQDPDMLAKEVLREIPKQLTSYFKQAKIHPNPPIRKVENSLGLTDMFHINKQNKMIKQLTQNGMSKEQSE
jgi:hypothetical protein